MEKILKYLNIQYKITEIKTKLILSDVLAKIIFFFIISQIIILVAFALMIVLPFILIFYFFNILLASGILILQIFIISIIVWSIKDKIIAFLRKQIINSIENYERPGNL